MILASSRKLVRHARREIASCVARYAWTSPRRLSRSASPTRSSTNAGQGPLASKGSRNLTPWSRRWRRGISRVKEDLSMCVCVCAAGGGFGYSAELCVKVHGRGCYKRWRDEAYHWAQWEVQFWRWVLAAGPKVDRFCETCKRWNVVNGFEWFPSLHIHVT